MTSIDDLRAEVNRREELRQIERRITLKLYAAMGVFLLTAFLLWVTR